MSQLFSDRDRELHFLESHYASGKAELVILYGGRELDTAYFLEPTSDWQMLLHLRV